MTVERDYGPDPRRRRKSWTLRGCRSVAAAAMGAVGGLLCAIGATLIVPPRPWLIWNASASAPVGLYAVEGEGDYAVGDMVAARVPPAWRSLAGARRYLPVNVPLIKRIAAGPSDHVCALGTGMMVNGKLTGRRRELDGEGRSMPWWMGCRTLRTGEYLLFMDAPTSFDGRYFGPTAKGEIVGRVELRWAP